MLKKCLIALILVALTAPAFAHEMWGYGVTTSVKWEWAERSGPDIPVYMKVVMWADLDWERDSKGKPKKTELVLKQQADTGYFQDCIKMMLCVNFSGIKVGAKFVPNADALQVNTSDKDKGWRISVEDWGDAPSWSSWEKQPSSALQVTTVHLTKDGRKPIAICLEMRDVDNQGLEYDGLKKTAIGTVFTTLLPTLAPPGQPANGIIDSMFNPDAGLPGAWIP
jgi:hypothetical protein